MLRITIKLKIVGRIDRARKKRDLKYEQKQKERCARFLLDMSIKYSHEVKKENQEIKEK